MAAPGIKDVAIRAGVSVGTVSNVLNRPQLVSDEVDRLVNVQRLQPQLARQPLRERQQAWQGERRFQCR